MARFARLNLRKNNLAFLSHPCEIERNKLKLFSVKKFILFDPPAGGEL
jgi:hypothetical protein